MESLLDRKRRERRLVCKNATLVQRSKIDTTTESLGLTFDPFFRDNQNAGIPRGTLVTHWDNCTVLQPLVNLLHYYFFYILQTQTQQRIISMT